MNTFNKLYEDIFKPASPEEVIKRKEIAEVERFKEWCDENGVKYTLDDKGNIISFDKNTINNKNKYGSTALIWASINNNIEIAKILLDNGADVNIKNNSGGTALMFASANNYMEIVKLLLAKGADPNIKSWHGNTALLLASKKNNIEIVKLLKQHGVKE